MPELLDCDITNQLFIDSENVVLTKNGKQLNVLFKTISANEKLSETIEFKTSSIPLSELEEDIILRVIGTVHGEENTYISNDYIRTVLQHASYRVGTFTSPALVNRREVIRINNVPISEEDIIRIANRLCGLLPKGKTNH